jgi:hypothetical protein
MPKRKSTQVEQESNSKKAKTTIEKSDEAIVSINLFVINSIII